MFESSISLSWLIQSSTSPCFSVISFRKCLKVPFLFADWSKVPFSLAFLWFYSENVSKFHFSPMWSKVPLPLAFLWFYSKKCKKVSISLLFSPKFHFLFYSEMLESSISLLFSPKLHFLFYSENVRKFHFSPVWSKVPLPLHFCRFIQKMFESSNFSFLIDPKFHFPLLFCDFIQKMFKSSISLLFDLKFHFPCFLLFYSENVRKFHFSPVWSKVPLPLHFYHFIQKMFKSSISLLYVIQSFTFPLLCSDFIQKM